jgi:hypothetical protein
MDGVGRALVVRTRTLADGSEIALEGAQSDTP